MTDRFQEALKRNLAAPRKSVTASVQEGERGLTTKPLNFLVTYRISRESIPGKGGYDERRNAVLERIRALAGEEWHLSTSAWKITSRRSSLILRDLLSEPLYARFDFLSVTSVGTTRTFGDANLED